MRFQPAAFTLLEKLPQSLLLLRGAGWMPGNHIRVTLARGLEGGEAGVIMRTEIDLDSQLWWPKHGRMGGG